MLTCMQVLSCLLVLWTVARDDGLSIQVCKNPKEIQNSNLHKNSKSLDASLMEK